MADLMNAFQIGQGIGKANAFPGAEASGNILDMFNQQMQNQMKLQQQAALFKGEKNYEWSNSPQSQEAQAKLNASGFGPGSQGGGTGGPPPGTFGNPPPSSGTLGSDVPTEFTSITGQKYSNQNAEVSKQVAQKALDESSTGVQAAKNVLPVLDRLHDLYYQGLGSEGPTSVKPGDVIGARINPLLQQGNLAMQGASNPAWTTYKKELESFSNLIGRGAYGEVGRIPFLQNMQNIRNFPTEGTTAEQADQLWKGNYQVVGAHIKNHNMLVDQTVGDNPLLKVNPDQFSKYLSNYTKNNDNTGLYNNQGTQNQPETLTPQMAMEELRKRGRKV